MQSLFAKVKPAFVEIDPYKFLLNVGCLMDYPTAAILKGVKGESIVNGGMSIFTAVVGKGNTFKSTIMHYMTLSAAAAACASGTYTYINVYDTEVNLSPERYVKLSHRFDIFKDRDIVEDGICSITDKTHHLGNEWFKILKTFLKEHKIKNRKQFMVTTPFLDKEGKQIQTLFPSFSEVDSISEFETADIIDIQDKNQLGDSAGNTIHMRSGLAKTRLMMEIPSVCNSAAHYMGMTAHVGKDIPIQTGPVAIPDKKLQHMRAGEKIKGVADKFFFLPTALWQTTSSTALNNQNTKGPEYPRRRDLPDEGSSDLNLVKLKMLRNKFGGSGFTLDIIVSQSEGVLPSLTEFHYIKENDRWGLEGSLTNYHLDLLPDVSLSRTTVREKIDNDPKLRRAIKITADLLQLKQYFTDYQYKIPTPKELYDKIKENYDWDTLFATRDFWTYNQYDCPVPYLSTVDLVHMYHGVYHPYFLQPVDKKAA